MTPFSFAGLTYPANNLIRAHGPRLTRAFAATDKTDHRRNTSDAIGLARLRIVLGIEFKERLKNLAC